MKKILSQPYIIVNRTIENNQQSSIEEEEYLHLYEDRIITSFHSFHLHEVYDVSFKQFSTESGFLYLHTNRGVYSYKVENIPKQFIEEFKILKL